MPIQGYNTCSTCRHFRGVPGQCWTAIVIRNHQCHSLLINYYHSDVSKKAALQGHLFPRVANETQELNGITRFLEKEQTDTAVHFHSLYYYSILLAEESLYSLPVVQVAGVKIVFFCSRQV